MSTAFLKIVGWCTLFEIVRIGAKVISEPTMCTEMKAAPSDVGICQMPFCLTLKA